MPHPAKDLAIQQTTRRIQDATEAPSLRPSVETMFDEATFTATHIVYDPQTRAAAIIDSVLDYDAAAGRTTYATATHVAEYVRANDLHVEWQLETHVHADHLSAAPWLQREVGGKIGIGAEIVRVQDCFGKIFNAGTEFARDGSQFDRLFRDGDTFALGGLSVTCLHVPGHTPADMAYVIGDAVFVGDTLFMPDYGTARADFPGGSSAQLFRSIRRLMRLPDETRVFLCHDYKAPGRDGFAWETTIGAQRTNNVHAHTGVDEASFVAMRDARDATLRLPALIMPSVQINMRAGRIPPAEDNGTSYIKIPINAL